MKATPARAARAELAKKRAALKERVKNEHKKLRHEHTAEVAKARARLRDALTALRLRAAQPALRAAAPTGAKPGERKRWVRIERARLRGQMQAERARTRDELREMKTKLNSAIQFVRIRAAAAFRRAQEQSRHDVAEARKAAVVTPRTKKVREAKPRAKKAREAKPRKKRVNKRASRDATPAMESTDKRQLALPHTEPLSLEWFAKRAQSVADAEYTRKFHDKAFISSVYEVGVRGHVWDMPLDAFKRYLVDAHRARLLRLSRADLVQAMDAALVRDSETRDRSSEFHFVDMSKPFTQRGNETATAERAYEAESLRERVLYPEGEARKHRKSFWDLPAHMQESWRLVAKTAPVTGRDVHVALRNPERGVMWDDMSDAARESLQDVADVLHGKEREVVARYEAQRVGRAFDRENARKREERVTSARAKLRPRVAKAVGHAYARQDQVRSVLGTAARAGKLTREEAWALVALENDELGQTIFMSGDVVLDSARDALRHFASTGEWV